MNFDQARFNMIEQQIRPWEVLDETVLLLLEKIPREHFVPETDRRLAYADVAIPLGDHQYMLHPKLEAKALHSLRVNKSDSVLEIGTGSGYMTALLATLAKHVVSVDIREDFTARARTKLEQHEIRNVELDTADAATGYRPERRFDVIFISGSLPLFPEYYQQQLKPGGRMFVIVGESPIMEAQLVRRRGENAFSKESLFETDVPVLDNAPQPQRFVF